MKRLTKYALVTVLFGVLFFAGGIALIGRGGVDAVVGGAVTALFGAALTSVGAGFL